MTQGDGDLREQVRALQDEIRALKDEIRELARRLDNDEKDAERENETLHTLEHIVKGNGDTGLLGKVEMLEARVDARGKTAALAITAFGVIVSVVMSVVSLIVKGD